MSFDYSTSGLPDNNRWKIATMICFGWLEQNMKARFGEDGITNFMHNQPIRAATNVMNNCEDWTEESVTLLLMGPAKGALIANDEAEIVSRYHFGERAVDLLKSMIDSKNATDPEMLRDVGRITLAEGISAMSDQMVDRHLFEKQSSRFMMHDKRKVMLAQFEVDFTTLKGIDPKLDAVYEEYLVKSRFALGMVDKEMASVKKTPKPPGM